MSRHDLQDEAQAEEDTAAPPAHRGEEVPRLADSDQRIGGRAGSTEAGGQAAALSTLQQNGKDKDDAVDDEQSEKKRVKH